MTTEAKPFDMVVVGATGDLSRRKLLPALFYLHKRNALPVPGRILTVVRRTGDPAEFLASIATSTREHMQEGDFSEDAWASFLERIRFVHAEMTDASSYGELNAALGEAPERDRIFYLATPPDLYTGISRTLETSGLVSARSRIVLEKPIGTNLATAEAINGGVGAVFGEDRIFRIDHYLGKETVQNLMVLRFGNALFEPMWCSDRIDHVQITVAETLGVEGRGDYYDKAGALRDMVQNHLLQLLCLVAMEPPARLDQEAIRNEKIKVLRALRPITGDDVATKTVRGQYRAGVSDGRSVAGYVEEDGIAPESQTETFVALKAEIDNWRWAGVPFYLRTGKRMQHRVSEIIIQFKKVPHSLFGARPGLLQNNRLAIRLQPDESIKLGMMIKEPGAGMTLRPVNLNLNLADTFPGRTPDAYERLLMDVIRGNPTLFMHRAEVEEAWRFIEPILAGWKAQGSRPRAYLAGTWGPSASDALVEREGRSWYEQLAL